MLNLTDVKRGVQRAGQERDTVSMKFGEESIDLVVNWRHIFASIVRPGLNGIGHVSPRENQHYGDVARHHYSSSSSMRPV